MSMLSEAGFFGRPGIVMISPESTYACTPSPDFDSTQRNRSTSPPWTRRSTVWRPSRDSGECSIGCTVGRTCRRSGQAPAGRSGRNSGRRRGRIDERWSTRPDGRLARHGLASLRRMDALTLRCPSRKPCSKNSANRRDWRWQGKREAASGANPPPRRAPPGAECPASRLPAATVR